MQLTENERAALVEELEAAVAGRLAVGIVLNRFSSRELDCVKTGDEIVDKAVMPIIDRLLAAADAPGLGLQNEITEWANARFGGKDDHQRFTKLQNEVAELGRLSVNNRDGIKDECADIMHLLFQYAYWYRFDLLEATRDKFEINKARAWARQTDGTYQHMKEATDE